MTWTARLSSARSLEAIQINWAHAPGELRVLTSPDGSNFEEAACWRKTGKADDSFVETLEFNRTGVVAKRNELCGHSRGYTGQVRIARSL